MKGIPIKFRGKAENGEYVYGDLMQGNYDESAFHIKPRKKRPVYVDKNSVAQLLGYDVDGAEIYEGDEIENTDLLTGKSFRVKAQYCGINYAHFNFKLANKKSPNA